MINIQFNGELFSVEEGISLNTLLDEKGYQGSSFAVAINECFVPRSQWQKSTLQSGDRLEVLTAMQGG